MQRREETIDPNSFARRHIGPNEEEVRVMLREVGFEDLDSLVEAAVPRNIRLGSRPEPAGGEIGDRSADRAPRDFQEEQDPALIHRLWLFRLHYAASDPAKHTGEPGLVHGLHTLSGGARARPTRSPPQLPDDDHRPDSARDCQCVAA